MKRLLIGSVLAALAVYLWGALFWYGPGTAALYTEVIDQQTLREDLLAQLRGSGTYRIPWDPQDIEGTMELLHQGPVATIHFHRDGVDPRNAGMLTLGFLHVLVSVLLFAAALRMVAGTLPRYADRARYVVLFAAAAAVFANLGGPIWWQEAWSFHLIHAIYDFTSWLLAGLVLAAFVPPEPLPAEQPPETEEELLPV
jgi:hypothetical protein